MKDYIGMISFILCLSLVMIMAMVVSQKVQSETPIDITPKNPPPVEELCWYAEKCPNE